MNKCVSRYGEPVYLNVYDIFSYNNFLHPIGLGFYHTGIEVNGVEYIFGDGVMEIQPKQDLDFATFRESIEIGRVKLFSSEIRRRIYTLSNDFTSDDYNPILNNCNDFSNAVSQRLLNKNIPNYINRWANTGKTLNNIYNNLFGSCKNKCKKFSTFSGNKYNLK